MSSDHKPDEADVDMPLVQEDATTPEGDFAYSDTGLDSIVQKKDKGLLQRYIKKAMEKFEEQDKEFTRLFRLQGAGELATVESWFSQLSYAQQKAELAQITGKEEFKLTREGLAEIVDENKLKLFFLALVVATQQAAASKDVYFKLNAHAEDAFKTMADKDMLQEMSTGHKSNGADEAKSPGVAKADDNFHYTNEGLKVVVKLGDPDRLNRFINNVANKLQDAKNEFMRLFKLQVADELEKLVASFNKLTKAQQKDELAQLTGREDFDFTKESLTEIVDENKLHLFFLGLVVAMQKADASQDEYIILKCDAEKALKEVQESLTRSIPHNLDRIAPLTFGIRNELIIQQSDLTKIQKEVYDLFDWFLEDKNSPRYIYTAPYFPIIQSSGMGKTKLLYELAKELNGSDNETFVNSEKRMNTNENKNSKKRMNTEKSKMCLFILCGKPNPDEDKDVFDAFFEPNLGDNQDKNVEHVEDFLESLLAKEAGNQRKVVLLFDEAQNLLRTKNAFAFCCVRRWITKVNTKTQVVAVFSGKSSALANFYPESKKKEYSRGVQGVYRDSGFQVYPPFFRINSIGCLSLNALRHPRANEYEQAVMYGRPLFVKLLEEEQLLERETSILQRMVLTAEPDDPKNWIYKKEAYIAVLATRVQMAPTSFNVVSELVATGYANLTNLTKLPAEKSKENDEPQSANFQYSYTAEMCYFPDPVLSRLAMCLMDETWSNGQYHGQAKRWWVHKMMELFSNGQCRPPKGDVGELFAAAYLLFCGDEIRKEYNDDYRTFAVPVRDWISQLLLEERPETLNEEASQVKTSVSFIQVCRDYLRYPGFEKNLAERERENELDNRFSLGAQGFLESLFKSAVASYTYNNCAVADLFASIQICRDGKERYVPLLVSVKARETYDESQVARDFEAMKQVLARNDIEGGLCMLVLFGGTKRKYNVGDVNLKSGAERDALLQDLDKKKVSILVHLRNDFRNDDYGIVTSIPNVPSDSSDLSEIHQSHAALRSHNRDEYMDSDLVRLRKHDLTYLVELRDDLDNWRQYKNSNSDSKKQKRGRGCL